MQQSLLPQVPGTFYVALRQDLVRLCQERSVYRKEHSKASPYCKALILAILDHWTYDNLSKKKPEQIHITIPQWEALMYSMFKRKVIIDSLEELYQDGWIGRAAFKAPGGGHNQYRYTLQHETINALLATFTNAPCSDDQRSQMHDQRSQVPLDSSQMHLAKGKNEPSSSVATFTSNPLIEEENKRLIEAKKEEPPALQSSESLFSQEEEEFLSWLQEKGIHWSKDVEKVRQHITFVRDAISTRDQLHRYCDHAKDVHRRAGKTKPALGNLANRKLLDGFLQAEQAMQPFLPPAPLEMSSQSDIEALAAQILQEYPEIVLVYQENEYGPYLEMPICDDDSQFADGVRDAEDWRTLRADRRRLAQVLEYGRSAKAV